VRSLGRGLHQSNAAAPTTASSISPWLDRSTTLAGFCTTRQAGELAVLCYGIRSGLRTRASAQRARERHLISAMKTNARIAGSRERDPARQVTVSTLTVQPCNKDLRTRSEKGGLR
jgi:hypothetical protein